MAEDIVETTERIEIAPSGDGETVGASEGETPAEGGEPEAGEPAEGEAGEPEEKLVRRPEPTATPAEPTAETGVDENGGIVQIDGETPKEFALRLEVTRLKGSLRKERTEDLLGRPAPVQGATKEISPERAALLAKYKPEELNALREVLPLLAEDLGFVRSDQLKATEYNQTAEGELSSFLERHPEYDATNDKEGILWNRMKEEFAMYKPPQNPKDYRKILERAHRDIFGIKAVGDKGTINAAQRKVQVASHAGASGPTRTVTTTRPKTNTEGLRLDQLKGFSPEDIAEMTGN